LFTVVHEQFFTDTTDYADIILPATTFFEHKDLQTGYGHYFVQISNQAIEPLGECRSNVELFRALALRMGFDDPCFRQSVDEMIDLALSSPHPHLAGIDRARLERDHIVRLNLSQHRNLELCHPERSEGPAVEKGHYLPFANGFPTPSGKALLYNEELAAQGLDPVVSFTPPQESRHTADRRYPLELLARKCDNYLNSTFSNLPAHQAMEHPDLLEISTADAEPRGIRDGDRVRVFNSRGEIALTSRVNGATQAGVVAARLNWAKLTGQSRNINVLTSERLTDMGGGATFYSTLVEVEPFSGRDAERSEVESPLPKS
jgi:anaerobic selenocysteine-containing dehydrogenase